MRAVVTVRGVGIRRGRLKWLYSALLCSIVRGMRDEGWVFWLYVSAVSKEKDVAGMICHCGWMEENEGERSSLRNRMVVKKSAEQRGGEGR